MVALVPGKRNDGVLLLYIAADQLVGLRDPDHFCDAGELFQVALIDSATVAGDADGGALRAGHGMGAKAQQLNLLADGLDFFRRGLRFHDHEHGDERPFLAL